MTEEEWIKARAIDITDRIFAGPFSWLVGCRSWSVISALTLFILHLFAALAQKERALISKRTAEALAAAKARGVALGNPKIDEAREKALAEIVDRADQRAANVIPIMRQIQRSGATSLRQIAEALNARGIRAPRGGQWHATSVRNVMARA